MSSLSARCLAAAVLGLCALTAQAQTLDITPSYQSQGPDGNYFEIYQDELARFEFAHPGLTHEQSTQDPTKVSVLLYGAQALATPLPVGPFADLWINPATLNFLIVPPSLELDIAWPLGFTTEDVLLNAQAATIEIQPTVALLFASDPIELVYVPPPVQFNDRMVPEGALEQGTESITFDAQSNGYRLAFDDGVDPVEYVINLNDPRIQNGTLRILELNHNVFAVNSGGFFYTQGLGVNNMNPTMFENFGTHTLVAHLPFAGEIVLVYVDQLPVLDGGPNVVRFRAFSIGLSGRSLSVRGLDLDPVPRNGDTYFGFTLGGQALVGGGEAEPVRVPYMDQIGITMVDREFFASSFIDIFNSGAQLHGPATFQQANLTIRNSDEMFYLPNIIDEIAPVDERGWVTVSNEISSCFVGTTAPRSARADDFDSVVGIGFTGEPIPNKYLQDQVLTQSMIDWGFDRILAWKFHWMNAGLNRRSSTHAPADPRGGTDQELRDWAAMARGAGWLVALYGDFYSLDQAPQFFDNPNYSEGDNGTFINYEDAVIGPTGEFARGFQALIDNSPGGQGGPDYFTRILSPKRSLRHFAREAQLFKNDYQANSADFDVIPISTPDLIRTGDPASNNSSNGPISYDPNSSNDSSIKEAINTYKNLFILAQQVLDGPVFGEGSFFNYTTRFDSFYAGYIDGVWRTLSTIGAPNDFGAGGMSELVVPDYEVNIVLPKMTGLFGMGLYSRFFEVNQPVGSGIPLSDLATNEWRVTEIAYMHNGLMHVNSLPGIDADFLTDAQKVKEYYTMLSLTDERQNAGQAVVEYRNAAAGSPWRTLSDAFKTQDIDLARCIVRLTFDSGLVVVTNHTTVETFEAGYRIPANGWAAENFNTGYRNLSVIDPQTNNRYDEVVSPGWVLADGNGAARDFGGVIGVTTDLRVERLDQPLTLIELAQGRVSVQ